MSDCGNMGGCPDARIERLYEYLDGALSHQDLVEIKDHLNDCPQCAEEHDLECVIRSVVKRSCTEVAPSTLKASILDRISHLKTVDH
ncbi:mycothiol system anti-sigma-R factor [Arthrobacter sp. TMS1-12-1]